MFQFMLWKDVVILKSGTEIDSMAALVQSVWLALAKCHRLVGLRIAICYCFEVGKSKF